MADAASLALRQFILACEAQVQIEGAQVVIRLGLAQLIERLASVSIDTDARCTIVTPADLVCLGFEPRLVVGPASSPQSTEADNTWCSCLPEPKPHMSACLPQPTWARPSSAMSIVSRLKFLNGVDKFGPVCCGGEVDHPEEAAG